MSETVNYNNEKAGLWSRFFARSLDITSIFIIFFCFLLVLFILYPSSNPFHSTLNSQMDANAAGYCIFILFLPFYIFIDAAICSAFGNNFGNKLLGIRVISDDGSKISFSNFVKRNFIIYISCLTFGLPLVSTIASIINYSKYKKTGTTIWDRNSKTLVISYGSSNSRTALCAILYFVLEIIFSIIGKSIPENHYKYNNNSYSYSSNQQLNSGLPKRIDDVTILSSIVEKNNGYTYNYILRKENGEDIFISDENIINRLRQSITNDFSKRYCYGDLKTLKELGYSITNIYRERGNAVALEVYIDKSLCNN